MVTLVMRYKGLGVGLGLTVTPLITMITWHYRHIITHYKYVHNVLQMRAMYANKWC